MRQTNLFKVVLAVIAVNIAGILLRYFKLDSYIILGGFRFHISFVLPFLIIFRTGQSGFIKKLFSDPQHKRTVLPLLWILLPAALIAGTLLLLKKAGIGDPEYFYEFGLSSIVDYPVYLLWNYPQGIMFFIFLAVSSTISDRKFLTPFLLSILVFAFEFVPLGSEKFNYAGILSLIFLALSSGIMIRQFQNIYWFVIVIFSILWLYFLCFGSGSETIINLLFAARYNSWEGFFSVDKSVGQFLLPAQLFLTWLVILISGYFNRRKAVPGF